MDLKDTVPILFAGGAHGKYLYWILNNFTELGLHDHPEPPFDKFGGSHNQNVNSAERNYWELYKQGTEFTPFYVLHWFHSSDLGNSEAIQNFHKIVNETNKSILIRTTLDQKLQLLNHGVISTYGNDFSLYPDALVERRFRDYYVDPNKKDEVREFISYKAFDNEFLKHLNSPQHKYDHVLDIDLDDLLWHFEETIHKILKFLDTKLTAPLEKLLKYHYEMLSLQKHLTKDSNVQDFLDCFEQNIPCSLPKDCSIIDEAYIQKCLRDNFKLEIRCHGLINFPKTTQELRQITYPAGETS